MAPSHVALACLSRGTVTAGALYRPHPSVERPDGRGGVTRTAAFAELVFLSVEKANQVHGLGSRLLGRLKGAVLAQGLTRILTYADNTALSFFASHGFSPALTADPLDYRDVIGEYNDSVLMECVLDPAVPYARLPLMIRRARTLLLHAQANSHEHAQGQEDAGAQSYAGADGEARLVATPSRLLPAPPQPHIGAHLERAIRDLGRELADPADLRTDHGFGRGRLVPQQFHSLAGGSAGVAGEHSRLQSALAAFLASGAPEALQTERTLTAALERAECCFYSAGEQALGDLHREALTPILCQQSNPLRLALQPPMAALDEMEM